MEGAVSAASAPPFVLPSEHLRAEPAGRRRRLGRGGSGAARPRGRRAQSGSPAAPEPGELGEPGRGRPGGAARTPRPPRRLPRPAAPSPEPARSGARRSAAMGSRLSRQSSLEEESGEEPCPGRLESGRGDFHLSSLLLHPQKLPGVLRKASPAPYVRRVGWLREIQATIREHKREHAVHILRLLRKVPAAGCGMRVGQGQRAVRGCRSRGAGAPCPALGVQPSLGGLFVLPFSAPCPAPCPPCQAAPATSLL